MSQVRVRFAPSPTGTLHVGSARTALYNYLFARHQGGKLVLRIEDTDLKRSSRGHEESIVSDLEWLGLHHDEGPDAGGQYGPYRQSERSTMYREGVRRLRESGQAYRCFCSPERLEQLKEEQLRRGEMPKYDRACLALAPEEVERRLEGGEKATVRFRVPEGEVGFNDLIHGPISFSSDVIGDFIIERTDGGFAYNFAVVIDDAGMAITHVIRGEDHITNTARQLMLYGALDEEAPSYAHHSLIMGPDGGKLSKRHGATSIGEFREMGYLPEAVANYLALLSWHPSEGREKFSVEEAVPEFDLSRVSKSAAIFDLDKLNWLNGLYIRDVEASDLAALIRPYLQEAGLYFDPGQEEIVAAAVQANLVTLGDAPEYARLFAEPLDLEASEDAQLLLGEGADVAIAVLYGLLEIRSEEYFSLEEAREINKELTAQGKDQGVKGKALYKPLRVALTGTGEGPELFYLIAGLGRMRILARLDAARDYMEVHRREAHG